MAIQGINVVVHVLFWINKFVFFARFPKRNKRRLCLTSVLHSYYQLSEVSVDVSHNP